MIILVHDIKPLYQIEYFVKLQIKKLKIKLLNKKPNIYFITIIL